jgi:ATP-dependent RNA helicase RhlE
MTTQTQNPSGFASLGISPNLLSLLAQKRFLEPTPIQAQTIPIAIEGKDLVGIAQTGTGKTLAFGIPILQRLGTLKGLGLILAPTRELAQQIDEALRGLGQTLGLRTAVLIGGEAMPRQLNQLRRRPHIIIATPGRLLDHLEQRTVDLAPVRILVLDEADRMLDMGFAPQIAKVLSHVPPERQTMLFSATMPDAIARLSAKYMKLPVRVEIARSGTAAEMVTHEVFFVGKMDKIRLLEKLLAEYKGTILVFSRTKHGAKKMTRVVEAMGHRVAEIHSNRTLAQRRSALEAFKRGSVRVLVATDIAARGIDVTGIELVVNFDLPDNPEDYVHRIGRTARAGMKGHAISFATPDQRRDIRDIERLIRKNLPVSPLPELPAPRSVPQPAYEPERNQRRPFQGRPRSAEVGRRSTGSPFRGRSSSGGRPQRRSTSGRRPQFYSS